MRICLVVLFAATLGCGGGGSSTPDTVAPVLELLFPPAAALATTPTLHVSGTAADDRGVTSVTVNGIEADTSNRYANWSAEVPLGIGITTLQVIVRDAAGNAATAGVDVTRTAAIMAAPGAVAFDAVNGRALVVDRALGALLSIHLASGAMEVVSTALVSPQGIKLDTPANRALIVDSGLRALVAVDLDAGTVAVISDETHGPGPAFQSPRGLDFDPALTSAAFVVDSVLRSVIRVDLATGERVVIGGGLTNPQGIFIDPATGAFIADGPGVTFMDLATGLTADFTGAGPTYGNAIAIVQDRLNGRALVVDTVLGALLTLDLATGAREIVTGAGLPFPTGVAYDPDANRAVVTDSSRDALLLIDVDTAVPTTVAESGFGDGPALTSPRDLAADATRIIVADFARGLIEVATDRTEITGAGPAFQIPLGVSLDSLAGRAFVADSGAAALFAVDLASGARTIVSAGFLVPTAVAHDGGNDRVIVLDSGAFLSVDLLTGAGTPLPAGGGPLPIVPRGFALDATRDRLLLVDDGLDALLAVDLTTGTRTQLADGFAIPADVAVDVAGNRALVVDTDRDVVIVVDLSDGSQTVLDGAGPRFVSPDAIAYDGRILVVDSGLSALLAVDPESGDRVILSK